MKNCHNDEVGNLMASMAAYWALQCTITDLKMFKFPQRLAKESSTLCILFLAIIQCRGFQVDTPHHFP
jgi:hypothetical protein